MEIYFTFSLHRTPPNVKNTIWWETTLKVCKLLRITWLSIFNDTLHCWWRLFCCDRTWSTSYAYESSIYNTKLNLKTHMSFVWWKHLMHIFIIPLDNNNLSRVSFIHICKHLQTLCLKVKENFSAAVKMARK